MEINKSKSKRKYIKKVKIEKQPVKNIIIKKKKVVKTLTVDQICGIRNIHSRIKFFLLKTYKTEVKTKQEWELILKEV